MKKVIVGLSGGVDSAVTAYLLKEQGYEVVGVTLRTWVDSEKEVSKCCEIEDAERIARKLGIKYYIHNAGRDFCKYVTTPFVEDYINGLTPSPCVFCNRMVKFEGMMYCTHLFDADFIATGHYAGVLKLPNGRYTVSQVAYKDQTYMLYRLSQEQLSHLLMPLGGYTKEEVRQIARDTALPVAEKSDSQEICFVEDGHYADYVKARAAEVFPDTYDTIKNRLEPGNFVDRAGKVLGQHKGIIHYTIGQRKGLGIAFGHPIYVSEIRPETNEVVLSEEEEIFTKEVFCRNLNFLSISDLNIGEEIPAKVKIRYRHNAEPAVVSKVAEDEVKIIFEKPVRASTPGQSAVFYADEGYVIGGGVIVKK